MAARSTLVLVATALALASASGPVPDYALTHAPLVWLSKDEQHWPSKIETHLSHLTAKAPFGDSGETSPIAGAPYPVTAENLNDHKITPSTYLSLTDPGDMGILKTADWLHAEYGKPNSDGKSEAPVCQRLS